MKQEDWISGQPPDTHYFRSLRNRNPGIAEEKAQLCLLIGNACNKAPKSVCNGSVNLVRDFLAARKAAMKVASNSRSSVHELTCALASIGRFK